MGKSRLTFCGWRPSVSRLYLAAYYWPEDDDDCMISYARSKGYGIIKPNGLDVTVDVQAQGGSKYYFTMSELTESLSAALFLE